MVYDCPFSVLSSPSPDLIRGLTGRSSKHRPWILDCQSKSDACDFAHLVSAEVGQARLPVKPGKVTGRVSLTEKWAPEPFRDHSRFNHGGLRALQPHRIQQAA